MIEKIDHLGIAVESLADTIPIFRDLLGLELLEEEEVPEQKVRVAKFRVGDVDIELLEPTSPESPIAKFLSARGQGIHHIAYKTDDICGQIEKLVDKGAAMIDNVPRTGAGGMKIAFIHPKSTAKILTEICEGHHDN
jgi:methylmalonyl-CoA/ethylmalonyl-CoA epimerase